MTPEAIEVRDLAYARICALGIFKTTRDGIVEQLEPADQLPAVTVFVSRERLAPDGDANTGMPKFVNTLTLGVLITVDHGDKRELEPTLNRYATAVTTLLLTDIDFQNEIEAVTDIDQTQRFPADGETYYAEARLEFTIQFRSQWPPAIIDDLRQIILTTRPAPADDDTPAVTTRIDLPGP
ncbi:hypothetical protein [Methylobacterium durans]|uniref:Uncharacterized protein n=1 Tax=Methylobacterium durans TaxID=2202825 RepID=A0A2U8WAI8_9HYPH|nr:hypothetical protein [Methylobacterium durans]AWN43164.1 hypothetical protein DK389_25050 [Methylobacterium durans]